MLCNPGADFNLRDKKGKTPLSYALQQQQPTAAALLRQRGAEQCVPALPVSRRARL
jgi:ankyrin repeat protein